MLTMVEVTTYQIGIFVLHDFFCNRKMMCEDTGLGLRWIALDHVGLRWIDGITAGCTTSSKSETVSCGIRRNISQKSLFWRFRDGIPTVPPCLSFSYEFLPSIVPLRRRGVLLRGGFLVTPSLFVGMACPSRGSRIEPCSSYSYGW